MRSPGSPTTADHSTSIWMAPYLPQWFRCLRQGPAKCLYYNDIFRDPLTESQ